MGEVGVEERGKGRGRKGRVSVGSISRRTGKEGVVKKSALGFRVCEVVFCLVSFSVMAADKTQGWAGDSFDRYKEYRYCLAMNILAYLLMSASSSAATRVDDWVTNWGKDTFTDMATASVGMSFLAFFAFAISSLISGYNLCNQDTS
ncbi:hypothetical protein Leryth_005685 [Lithospermum erythrorhizon]|nr:hypothetical protein Leryth_005685 [Lithospermum erythrorhizon]